MNKKEKITKYIRDVFQLYALNEYDFFYEYDEDANEQKEIPLFFGEKIDSDTLRRVSVHTGLTEKEILNMDQEAAKRFWNKYPFFRLANGFNTEYEWQHFYKSDKPMTEERLSACIFGLEDLTLEQRYDYPDVVRRMEEKLREIDEILPGTYHENAEITNIVVDTEIFFSYPQCKELLQSFIDIVNRAKTLFFKAINIGLPEDEINEWNFFASSLRMYDTVTPGILLTYDNILLYRDVYVNEGWNDFFSYVEIKRTFDLEIWKAKEFLDDITLVQEFVSVFPQAKAKMRKFAIDATKFNCEFIWSDAKPICFSQEEEKFLAEIENVFNSESIPLEQRPKEKTSIYVPKKPEEMSGFERYAQKLKNVTAPPAQGGLKLPEREVYTVPGSCDTFVRLKARIDARQGGNI